MSVITRPLGARRAKEVWQAVAQVNSDVGRTIHFNQQSLEGLCIHFGAEVGLIV
jgi:hypothetical protein